jgi:hypothetical protein
MTFLFEDCNDMIVVIHCSKIHNQWSVTHVSQSGGSEYSTFETVGFALLYHVSWRTVSGIGVVFYSVQEVLDLYWLVQASKKSQLGLVPGIMYLGHASGDEIWIFNCCLDGDADM